jgi:hypothetical protein
MMLYKSTRHILAVDPDVRPLPFPELIAGSGAMGLTGAVVDDGQGDHPPAPLIDAIEPQLN